jgi:hypothetical protein
MTPIVPGDLAPWTRTVAHPSDRVVIEAAVAAREQLRDRHGDEIVGCTARPCPGTVG